MLHTERTIEQPMTLLQSDGTDMLSPAWQRILLRNAHEGNASVTIVEDELNEICLFVIKGELFGVVLSYDTQFFSIFTLQEIIDWFRTMRIHALLSEWDNLEDRRQELCERSTEGENGLEFNLSPEDEDELAVICARLTVLDKTDWC